ncbi:MAG: C2 domain-containing protein [Armatimonadota bacterium]
MTILPGNDGELLPDSEWTLRVGTHTKDGNINPLTFSLDSSEKSDSLQRLSVWARSLTTPEHLLAIRPWNIDDRMLIELKVEHIRAITLPDQPNAGILDVLWHTIENDMPGKAGHAGITGLGGPTRKILRYQLCTIARRLYP